MPANTTKLDETVLGEDQGSKEWLTYLMNDLQPVHAMFAGMLRGSATWDPASIADGDEEVKSITVPGAALGDMVVGVSLSIDVADLQLSAQVTGTDTVKAQLLNNTGGAIDLGSCTVRVAVIKQATFLAPPALVADDT